MSCHYLHEAVISLNSTIKHRTVVHTPVINGQTRFAQSEFTHVNVLLNPLGLGVGLGLYMYVGGTLETELKQRRYTCSCAGLSNRYRSVESSRSINRSDTGSRGLYMLHAWDRGLHAAGAIIIVDKLFSSYVVEKKCGFFDRSTKNCIVNQSRIIPVYRPILPLPYASLLGACNFNY